MPITTGRYNPSKVRFRMLDNNWPDNADQVDGTVLIAPTSITYSGTSATVNGNGFVTFDTVGLFTLNGIFTSEYDDYIVTIACRSNVSQPNLGYRLTSGVNVASNNYVRQNLYANGTSITSGRTTGLNQGYFCFADNSNGEWSTTGVTAYFYRPFLNSFTYSRSLSADSYSSGSILEEACGHQVAQSNTGLYVFPSSGLITGTIGVFGVRI